MTVLELIEELSQFDDNLKVVDWDFDEITAVERDTEWNADGTPVIMVSS